MDTTLMLGSLDVLFIGLLYTVLVSSLAIVFSVILGTFFGVFMVSGSKPTKVLIRAFVYVIRGTPTLVQMFIVYFGLPMIGIKMNAFQAGVFTLTLHSGAYVTEIVRAGLESVGIGQIEAGKVLNISLFKTTIFILLPQSIRYITPNLANEAINLVKNSSLLATIGAYELTRSGQTIVSQTYKPFEIYILVALMYLLFTTCLSLLSDFLEHRVFGRKGVMTHAKG